MKRISKPLIFVAFLLGALVLAGCTAAPIYNVKNVSVTASTSTRKPISTSKVKVAITRAAAGLGWKIRDVKPGLMYASLYLRGHFAQVAIPYSSKSYSILYHNSKDLNYDGKEIHRNYNSWVKNLDNAIQTNLSVTK